MLESKFKFLLEQPDESIYLFIFLTGIFVAASYKLWRTTQESNVQLKEKLLTIEEEKETLENTYSNFPEKSEESTISQNEQRITYIGPAVPAFPDVLLPSIQASNKRMDALIESYHVQALRQSAIQFWFSILAATLGFISILFMVINSSESENTYLLIKIVPGAVISSVSILFFKQSTQTRQKATEFFDSLRQDAQHKDSIKLINSIDNADLKSVVKSQLALKIGGIETSINELHSVIQNKEK